MNEAEICKRATVNLTRLTGDPITSIYAQNTYNMANSLGRSLAGMASQDLANEYSDKLMLAWPGQDIEAVCDKPEFVMALCSLLCNSLVQFTNKVAKG